MTEVASADLKLGDIVIVTVGEVIPGDGDIIAGIASVDESAITGESAPVVREHGGDRSAVTGGTRVLSDRIVVQITSKPGETFVDRMIRLVEGASRQKTPNEIALNILLASLTIIFLVVVLTLNPMAAYLHGATTIVILIALLVCLIPTDHRRPAERDRHRRHGPAGAAQRARHVGPRGRGPRRRDHAPAGQDRDHHLRQTGRRPSSSRSAASRRPSSPRPHGCRRWRIRRRKAPPWSGWPAVPCTCPRTRRWCRSRRRPRMSGLDLADGSQVRKGAGSMVAQWVGDDEPRDLRDIVDRIAQSGGTPLVVATKDPKGTGRVLGVIHLKDVVKTGLKERFAELRTMGIRTVMITGDNPLTAKAIAAEAGVDDFLAEATPEDKMALIRKEQEGGNLVAMTGDGTNDAPALAQADVGVAMNTGTSAAKEAGNMVDLDSDPTKLIDIVRIGKQLLITRGSLTTFSIANDVAKYFAIIPAMFAAVFPGLAVLNIMQLHSPASAVLSAIIFNALVIVALIPLALRGVRYRARPASQILSRNLLIYGLGGIIAPFIGIKVIDLIVTLIPGF